MAKRKSKHSRKEFMVALREVRVKLHEINQKLDHLIKSYRKFYFTTDFSDSLNHGFKGWPSQVGFKVPVLSVFTLSAIHGQRTHLTAMWAWKRLGQRELRTWTISPMADLAGAWRGAKHLRGASGRNKGKEKQHEHMCDWRPDDPERHS
jgi:hypothetical protein